MSNFADYYVVEISENDIIPLKLVKSYLRIDEKEEDHLIEILVKSAIEYAEDFTGLSIRQKIIEAKFCRNKQNKLRLPKTPILSISEISIINKSGTKKNLDKKRYKFDSETIILADSPEIWDCLNIKYVTGYEKDKIPSKMIAAILSHIAVMYDNRMGEISAPMRSLNIYSFYKKRYI